MKLLILFFLFISLNIFAEHGHIIYAIATRSEVVALSEEQKATLNRQIFETYYETTRQSLDKTKVLLKWTGDNPLTALGVTHTTYNYTDILTELAKPTWRGEL